jgi:hypothetical protein
MDKSTPKGGKFNLSPSVCGFMYPFPSSFGTNVFRLLRQRGCGLTQLLDLPDVVREQAGNTRDKQIEVAPRLGVVSGVTRSMPLPRR